MADGVIFNQQAIQLPTGAPANRPATPVAGMTRWNTTSGALEFYSGSSWIELTFFSPTNISGLIGWYDVGSVSGTTWTDKSGSGNNATISGASVASTSGNGASNITSALYGSSTAHGVSWPVGILPSTYTLFHVARYTGGTNQRIFDGYDINWLSGFHGGNSGVAYHNGWLMTSTNIHGNNWVISTDQNSLYRSNGVQRGTGGGASSRIRINSGTSETSTFMVTEVIVYNRTLSSTEYGQVESYLSSKYGITIG